MNNSIKIPFIKMHGTGNDFVIIDCREHIYPNNDVIRIADRKRGIGCDQTIFIYSSGTQTCKIEIFNPDGSMAEMCGNAVRCIFWLITSDKSPHASIQLSNRVVYGERLCDGQIKVNMGKPLTHWQDIPLLEPQNTLTINLDIGDLKSPTATNIGNPHLTYFVDDVNSVPFEKVAPLIENHSLFPNRINVSIAQVLNGNEIRVRIWERGTGITESCGSAACATLIAAIRRGLVQNNKAKIRLPGGDLMVEFDGDCVYKTGDAVLVFEGKYIQQFN
ncbi:diaminopimelate epimerase-like [Bradysia coprophila]|uniref:diaminopimelate epimerase-like n=1 Tax=Bradysia coprophila TaxID=38358 RepID=UPI00187DD80F|nr:diaminopimelate epimerase-like [Bradysia coprophila]